MGQQIFNWTYYEGQSARNRILIGHLVHPNKCWDPLHTIFAKFSMSLCLTEAAPSMGNQLVEKLLPNVKFKSMALWPVFSGSYSTPSNQSLILMYQLYSSFSQAKRPQIIQILFKHLKSKTPSPSLLCLNLVSFFSHQEHLVLGYSWFQFVFKQWLPKMTTKFPWA